MATVVFPADDWAYKFNDNEESKEDLIIEGETKVSFQNSDALRVSVSKFNTTDTLTVYNLFEDGISISDDNMFIVNAKATLPPTFFSKFEVYIEDCNGETGTYALDNNMVGKEIIILTEALLTNTKFNPSFVTKVGFRFSNLNAERDFKFILKDIHTVYRIQPTYAQPDEVIELLGMVDNKGKVFELTDTSVPSYNALAKRICEAEEFMENACRDAWTERRVTGEIRNADSTWATSLGYMGIFSSDGLNSGFNTFFKGVPVKLIHDHINKIDYSKGDLIEIRKYGSNWSVVPEGQFWADETKGILYIKQIFFQQDASVRVTYRYGHGPVPSDIKQAVLLKTAMLVVGTDWYRQRFPTMDGNQPMKVETLNQWTWVIKDIIRNHTDLISCGSF